jgi:ribosomal protein S18 acetylase RimI-like enzyme
MDETTFLKPELDDFEVTIEHAKPEDAEAMMRLKRSAQIQAYVNKEHNVTTEDMEQKFTEEDVLRGTKNWESGIAGEPHDGQRQTFVARLDGRVVGFTSPCFEDNQWRIGQLYVDPDFQGRHIGPTLLDKALEWLGTEKDIYLHVFKGNDRAIGLYEKFGFEPTGKEFEAEVDEEGRKLLPEIEMLRPAEHA